MDKKDTLFKSGRRKLIKGGKGINLNQLLEYNQTHFICQDEKDRLEVSWIWENGTWINIEQICVLKDKVTRITLKDMFTHLVSDYSFKGMNLIHSLDFWRKSKKNTKCGYGSFSCKDSANECVPNDQVCDGIPQCSDGTDESLDGDSNCRKHFDYHATIECEKSDTYNLKIMTMAIPCNGVEECKYGIDEEGCGVSRTILVKLAIYNYEFGH